eukprot:scaffold19770_cov63-Phaeocystis_antarctica.AAC.1
MLRRRSTTAHTHDDQGIPQSAGVCGSRCRPVRAPLAQGQHDRLLGAHRLACVLVGAVAAPDDIVTIELPTATSRLGVRVYEPYLEDEPLRFVEGNLERAHPDGM